MILSDNRELDNEELLELWRQGRRIAARYCARHVYRLARGEGGFYDADDFWQDLFLAFAKVVLAWRTEDAGLPEALWRRWRRALWGGGIHILRRAPQRLWCGVEWSVDPTRLAMDHPASPVAGDELSPLLTRTLLHTLVDRQDAETVWLQCRIVDDLETRLWRLRPLQRQALYLVTLQHWQPGDLAQQLALPDRRVGYRLLYEARRQLRRPA